MAASLDEYRASLLRFAERMPELLQRHGATSGHAARIRDLDLRGSLEGGHFTVALIGRMKAGKSTLLNALIGGRRLAPVAVNEMTATVNWFDRGESEDLDRIAIHWKDKLRLPEYRPIEAMTELSGNSGEAEKVEYVRFWSDSAFLDGIRLVDAPGLMSNNDSHQSATVDMVTRQYGARADATILVLPHVVSQSDKNVLNDFAGNTRLPGQAPYNTLAVFQRWESLNHPEPEKAAWDLARNFRDRLRSDVSDVIPVSGLLAIFARTVSEEAMDRLAMLATRAATADVERLLKTEERFGKDYDGVPFGGAERATLFEEIRQSLLGPESARAAGTYEMVKFAVWYAHRHAIRSGETLRKELAGLSNIDRLRETIGRRFCAISGLIQAGSVLNKALDPCRGAQIALRNAREHRRRLVQTGKGLSASADPRFREFAEQSVALFDAELAPIEATERELDSMASGAERDFNLLSDDIAWLNELGERMNLLPPELEIEARHIFGQHGFDRSARLGLPATTSLREQLVKAEALHQRFFVLSHTSKVAKHVVERLNLLLDELEIQLAK